MINNSKIERQLKQDGIDHSNITLKYIRETFKVDYLKNHNTTEEYINGLDDMILNIYFSTYWQNDMKKWKYSGLKLIDEVNGLNPRSVLDIGCGYNEFKNKIKFLTGIDPYNRNADIQTDTLKYQTDEMYDVVLALGSINFGPHEKISKEVAKAVSLTQPNGKLFFRVNPGVKHDKPESVWVDFYSWNANVVIKLAQENNCEVLDIRNDTNQRIYFVLSKGNLT
jgi:SAM-dependent methyltransferase